MPKPATVTTSTGLQLQLEGRVTMKEYRRFVDADSRGDYEAVYAFLAQVVKAWDLELDPTDPASYDELDVEEYLGVVRAVGEWLAGRQRAKN